MFEAILYTAAIVFVLWLRATPAPVEEPVATATPAPEPELVEESTPAATVAATISTPVAVLQVATPAPVEESTATAWATLTSQELRRACQDRGIRWRNAHGAGRHLKKPEMVAALTA